MNDDTMAQLVNYPPKEILHYSVRDIVDDCGILRERYTIPLYALEQSK